MGQGSTRKLFREPTIHRDGSDCLVDEIASAHEQRTRVLIFITLIVPGGELEDGASTALPDFHQTKIKCILEPADVPTIGMILEPFQACDLVDELAVALKLSGGGRRHATRRVEPPTGHTEVDESVTALSSAYHGASSFLAITAGDLVVIARHQRRITSKPRP